MEHSSDQDDSTQQSNDATAAAGAEESIESETDRLRTVSFGSDSSNTSSSSSSSYLSGAPMILRRNLLDENVLGIASSSSSDSAQRPEDVDRASPTPSTDSTSFNDNDTDSLHSSSAQSLSQVRVLDFSYTNLDASKINAHLTSIAFRRNTMITTLNLSGNMLTSLPDCLDILVNLEALDISSNALTVLPPSLTSLSKLNTLIASNNQLTSESFPKNFSQLFRHSLKVLSLGGNLLTSIPLELFDLTNLQSLYLGGNQISEIPHDIRKLINLKVLYLGGNQLTSIPNEVGNLVELQALSLCENRLRTLPSSIALLRNLKSLGLHKNLLTALPPGIVKLRGLQELSLRNNPLVSRFVKDFTFDCPSLLELAARAIKIHKVPFTNESLPKCLQDYLSTARRCVNNNCKGQLILPSVLTSLFRYTVSRETILIICPFLFSCLSRCVL